MIAKAAMTVASDRVSQEASDHVTVHAVLSLEMRLTANAHKRIHSVWML